MIRRLRRTLFGTADRTLTVVSTTVTLLGIAAAIFLVPYNTLIVPGLLFWLVVISAKYLLRDIIINDQRKIMSSWFSNSHHLTHNFRSALFSSYYRSIGKNSSTAAEKSLLSRICSDLTQTLKMSLVGYFNSIGIDIGDDIHIAVKMLITPDEAIEMLQGETDPSPEKLRERNSWIITIYRDHDTYTNHKNREVSSKIYSVEGNTASNDIVNLQKDVFCCDDLHGMGGGYNNESTDWHNQYNSTLVVPIRYKSEAPNRREHKCYGLLCVDSLNQQKRELYERRECFEIISHAADLLATFFLLVGVTDHQPSDGRSGSGIAPIGSRPDTIPEGGSLTESPSVHDHSASQPPTEREAQQGGPGNV
jgi:hypothetical protein